MNYYHRADSKLPKWLRNCIEGKIFKKASSVIAQPFVPYGEVERSTQLKNSAIENAIQIMAQEEKKDSSDDLMKRIEEAKTPEELEAIEKELNKSAEPAKEETKTETPATDEKKPDESATPSAGGSNDVEMLKKEIKDLKEKVEKLSGEEKLKAEIEMLKKKMENFNYPEDPNMNDTFFQSARSKVRHAQRIYRRIISKFKTFTELREIHSNEAAHHCLRLICVKCGNVNTCRCSTPKTTYQGVCDKCVGESNV